MMRPVSILTLLPTGNSLEEFHSHVPIWSGRVIKAERKQFHLSKHLKDLKCPGIYLLLNIHDRRIYVGEATNLVERILQHLRTPGKQFADTVICYFSIDNNFSVSHIKYLERKILEVLAASEKYKLVNRKQSQVNNASVIFNTEVDAYFENLRMILSISEFSDLLETANRQKIVNGHVPSVYTMRAGNCIAKARYTDKGMVVLRGSEMSLKHGQIPRNCIHIRQTLVDTNIVSLKKSKYVFNRNYTFSSLSAAATVIAGTSRNGRVAWKDLRGIAIKQSGK